ncbi:hypothetical protein K438DRAFT_1776671 [Mycena galopus ATCC 62051]|nr:hypothetical protein K438DRAFT_1776671 [Mycena galopus ATCC 62051]
MGWEEEKREGMEEGEEIESGVGGPGFFGKRDEGGSEADALAVAHVQKRTECEAEGGELEAKRERRVRIIGKTGKGSGEKTRTQHESSQTVLREYESPGSTVCEEEPRASGEIDKGVNDKKRRNAQGMD